ncbi:MAG TPA: hypothetical protein PK771_15355, partial [Spirochaetota bacterium]|nr:hypothetical protein [Spirochaetota bacterium]
DLIQNIGKTIANSITTKIIYEAQRRIKMDSTFPLYRVYDKQYIEKSLRDNGFTVDDLNRKVQGGSFNFANLDYIIFGNVYKLRSGTDKKIRYNLRVVNTFRGDVVYSYSYEVNEDLSDLETEVFKFASTFYWTIYNDNCSEIKFIAQNFKESDLKVWIKPKQIRIDDGRAIESSDKYLTEVQNIYYPEFPAEIRFWQILPGEYDVYAFLVNDRVLKKIDLKIGQREKKDIIVDRNDFKKEKGTILISGINPSTAFSISIKERPIYLKKPWEEKINYLENNFDFVEGEFIGLTDKYKDLITYKDNIITISDLNISDYDIAISSFAYKESNINGVKKISMSESGFETYQIFLRSNNKKSEEIKISKKGSSTGDRVAKITFIFNPVSDTGTKIEYVINDIPGNVGSGIERLILEDRYTEDGWKAVSENYITYQF